MIQVLAASELSNPYESTVFLHRRNYLSCSRKWKSKDIFFIINRYLAPLSKIKKYALSLFDLKSKKLKLEIYIQEESLKRMSLILAQKAFYLLDINVQEERLKKTNAEYRFKTAKEEAEIDKKKEEMYFSLFEQLPSKNKEAFYKIFPDWKTSKISCLAMHSSAILYLPKDIQKLHLAKFGFDIEEEEQREFASYFMHSLALEKKLDESIIAESMAEEIKAMQKLKEALQELKKKSKKKDSLGNSAFKEIEMNNQTKPYYYIDEYSYLGGMELNRSGYHENTARFREKQKLIAKMSLEDLFTEWWPKMRGYITGKVYEIQGIIEELQKYFFMDIDPYSSGFFVPLCMSIELIKTLNNNAPLLSEKKISSLSESDHKRYVEFEDLKIFLFDTAYSFFSRFPRTGGFDRNNLLLSFIVRTKSRSISVILSAEANGTMWDSPIGGIVCFFCCCITIVKTGEEMCVFVSTWDNFSNRQQKVHKDSKIIYKVMGMGFDSRALEHPKWFMPKRQIEPRAFISFKKDQKKVSVGQRVKGDHSFEENLENRFNKYEHSLKQEREREEREKRAEIERVWKNKEEK